MTVHRVEFTYTRTVVAYLEAVSADEIHEFLESDPEWEPLGDAPEIVDDDRSEMDDYSVFDTHGDITADYCIHEGEIREVETR